MTLQKIYPDNLVRPHGYVHAVVATGSKLIMTAGQVGCEPDLTPAGADYRSQARKAAENVYAAVTAAGATPADIVRMMVYVVDPTEANLDDAYEGLGEAAVAAGAKSTTMTLIGVTALSNPAFKIELDATAVID